MHSEELAKGAAFAQERAEREARLQRPLFVMPTKGVFTSGFGYRWGALHAGIDLAGPIGTPIYAVADGVVVDAGPTAGYGAWVKIRHSDGTVTLYGHVNTWTVQIGQRVFAGDQIATIGNRGNSTGPHLHFEVLPERHQLHRSGAVACRAGYLRRPLRRLSRCLTPPTRPNVPHRRSSGGNPPRPFPSPMTPAPASSAARRPGPSRRSPRDEPRTFRRHRPRMHRPV